MTPKPLDYAAPDLFESFGMTQLIDIPTRVTEDTTSPIDLFFTTNPENALNYGTLPKIADRDGIVCSFNINNEKPKSKFRLVYDYSKADEKGLLNFIKNFDFQNSVYSLPIIEQAEKFSLILQDAFALLVPCKIVMIRPKEHNWCNSFTRLLLRKKNRNYQFKKKSISKYIYELTKNNPNNDTVCRLKLNRDKAFTKSQESANQSATANKRTKTNFFNSVNSTMTNFNISAKKKISILTKLMNNGKFSRTPPLVEGEETVNDPLKKKAIFLTNILLESQQSPTLMKKIRS